MYYNDKDLEGWVKDLQKRIEKEEEQTYSKTVIEEYRNPINFGTMNKPDAYAEIIGPCKDTMKIYLKIKNNIITKGVFWTDGCGATIAAGNKLIKISLGKNIDTVSKISNKDLIESLDGLPDEHLHCAKLAADTIHKAIKNYHK